MPRSPRRVSESGFYHVIVRGCGRQLIFEDDADRRLFLFLLEEGLQTSLIDIVCWCLMDNHVHLLVSDPKGELSPFMHVVMMRYAQHFNRMSGHVGPVFQERFKSFAIESETYLLEAVRYIHNNPQKAGICSASDYRWSSYREYAGMTDVEGEGLVDASTVLDLLGGHEAFAAFCSQRPELPYRPAGSGRVPDEEMGALAAEALGPIVPSDLKTFSREKRDGLLLRLRSVGLSVRQIERLTGIGRCTISKVTNTLLSQERG